MWEDKIINIFENLFISMTEYTILITTNFSKIKICVKKMYIQNKISRKEKKKIIFLYFLYKICSSLLVIKIEDSNLFFRFSKFSFCSRIACRCEINEIDEKTI